MYDTKSRELRWNATYHDYSAELYDEAYDYSESLDTAACVWRRVLFSTAMRQSQLPKGRMVPLTSMAISSCPALLAHGALKQCCPCMGGSPFPEGLI